MIINDELLNKVERQMQENPHVRMNFNFHDSLDAKAQRLINVLLSGTVLPVHRHPHTVETYVLLRGKMFVVFCNDHGAQTERYLLDQTIGNYGVHIPAGQWHGIEVFEPSAIFEVKEGSYMPIELGDIMD